MGMRGRGIGSAGALAAAVAVAATASGDGGASATGFIATRDCQEHQAFIQGDNATVAARLPKRYSAFQDPGTGGPVLFVRALNCTAVTSGGQTAPATVA